MRGKRIIKFDLSNIDEETLKTKGIYKITNKINNHFYIGSTSRNFKERFKEHCRYYEMYKNGLKPNMHKILWAAYDKYGIENFKIDILEVTKNATDEEILYKEEQYIIKLQPEYNICMFPSYGGKPNKNKKLTDEWRQHIAEKSKKYKHSTETLKIVTENNKANAVKLKFEKDNSVLNFSSWVEAADYFLLKKPTPMIMAEKYNKLYRGYKITKLNTQKKKIVVKVEDEEIKFNSFNECDRFFNMWRGYTSTQVTRKNNLLLDKYKYIIV